MKRTWIFVAALIVAAVGVMTFGGSEKGSLKIGYVDLAKATDSYEKMVKLNEEYKKDFQFYQEKLKKIQEEIEKLEKSGASREEIDKKRAELAQKKQLFEGLLQQEYQPKIQEIFREVVQKVREYAQISGYDVILTNQGTAYASERVDITDEFIKFLNSAGGGK